ncbi:hypothetical protein Sm713_44150 [Streptomyces sp. TS71-3]|nr:hypothetical protein Sm713_44150 [Streptomyces sp. TS71-3]
MHQEPVALGCLHRSDLLVTPGGTPPGWPGRGLVRGQRSVVCPRLSFYDRLTADGDMWEYERGRRSVRTARVRSGPAVRGTPARRP